MAISQVVTPTKPQYRTRNWKEYNTALVNRGRITLWISPEVARAWKATKDGRACKQKTYSDLAIETILCLKILFKLTLRQAEGFASDLLALLGLDLPCPDYSTLSRRQRHLNVDLCVKSTEESIHLLIDSTGIKVAGEGEWKTRQWKAEYRRSWIKLHIGLDRTSGQIVAALVTDSSGGDADHLPGLLDSVQGEIDKVGADGAYDSVDNYRRVVQRGAVPIIPARFGAVIRPEREAAARNGIVSAMDRLWNDETGDARWKKESGYHARSRIESEMFRYKKVIGDRVCSKDACSQAVEVLLGCKILNRFLDLGRCESYPVALPTSQVT